MELAMQNSSEKTRRIRNMKRLTKKCCVHMHMWQQTPGWRLHVVEMHITHIRTYIHFHTHVCVSDCLHVHKYLLKCMIFEKSAHLTASVAKL